MNMKKIVIVLPVLLGLFVLATSGKDKEPISIGAKAPLADVRMTSTDGGNYALNDLAGENGLLVIFSCNTCPFVVGNESFEGWERQYNDLFREAQANGFGMVLLNANEAKRDHDDSFEAMKMRSEEKNYDMHYLVDSDSKLANAFGAKTTPHVFLFDADMKLVYTGTIDNGWDTSREETIPYLTNAIRALVDEQPVPIETTPPRGCSIKRK